MTDEQIKNGLSWRFREINAPISWTKRDDGTWSGLVICDGYYIDIPVGYIKIANNHIQSCYTDGIIVRPSGAGRARVIDIINAVIAETERWS